MSKLYFSSDLPGRFTGRMRKTRLIPRRLEDDEPHQVSGRPTLHSSRPFVSSCLSGEKAVVPHPHNSRKSIAVACSLLCLLSLGRPSDSTSAALVHSLADSPRQSQADRNVTSLEYGKSIERDLRGNQTEYYRIDLQSGQYLQVVAQQRGIDVLLVLRGPDSGVISEVDSPNGSQGPETLSAIAKAPGQHLLQVQGQDAASQGGRYQIKIVQLRDAEPSDISRVDAQKDLIQAHRLRAKGTKEDLENAVVIKHFIELFGEQPVP